MIFLAQHFKVFPTRFPFAGAHRCFFCQRLARAYPIYSNRKSPTPLMASTTSPPPPPSSSSPSKWKRQHCGARMYVSRFLHTEVNISLPGQGLWGPSFRQGGNRETTKSHTLKWERCEKEWHPSCCFSSFMSFCVAVVDADVVVERLLQLCLFITIFDAFSSQLNANCAHRFGRAFVLFLTWSHFCIWKISGRFCDFCHEITYNCVPVAGTIRCYSLRFWGAA